MKRTPETLSGSKIDYRVFLKLKPVTTTDQARVVVIIFTLCGLFMSTGMGMTLPIFAHLFKESSSGLRNLSFMTMVPHIALLLLGPFVGELEDRYGKRAFLLLGFAGLVVADIGFICVHSVSAYIGIRLFQAIVSVGIMPAMMGIFADVVPGQQRTHRISLMMAGNAGGLTLGPIVGGFLLTHWGPIAPFSISALLNLIVLCLVCIMIPGPSPTGPISRKPLSIRLCHGRYQNTSCYHSWYRSHSSLVSS
ncbi:hypothetical protein KDW_36780 [Dictyobacter vulcani]|uniref:Major facilitator superfamily (MFS) profile domain-containing protein n=1 Tax=Dictyobacter vulcani TaxID=2607529 RepID=A0A5J4KWD0_9CHLR|nr:MFS transporter [Dictyobacter vulcani]GER89516.1 hypothetical protein KDW_36780 [Dictyobacter vulcani]